MQFLKALVEHAGPALGGRTNLVTERFCCATATPRLAVGHVSDGEQASAAGAIVALQSPGRNGHESGGLRRCQRAARMFHRCASTGLEQAITQIQAAPQQRLDNGIAYLELTRFL